MPICLHFVFTVQLVNHCRFKEAQLVLIQIHRLHIQQLIIGATVNVTSLLKKQLRIFRALERLSSPSILLINWDLVS